MIKSTNFDPCTIFPSRIRKRKFTAEPIKEGTGASGATDLIKGKAFLPMANTAYARTVRLHESLHAIYTPKPSRALIKSGRGYTLLDQALEDARLHLNCARTSGNVRRDELATCLRDLHRVTSSSHDMPDKPLAALIALRSAAILHSQPYTSRTGKRSDVADKRLRSLCDAISPEYAAHMTDALACIRKGDQSGASTILAPYFDSEPEQPTAKAFPLAMEGETGDGITETMTGAEFTFDKLEGKLTSDAADMLSPATCASIAGNRMPTLFMHHLYATSMIPTFFGESHKHVLSGCKISAKKLATIIGPAMPKIFLKTIHRKGGSILIDASGSMSITPEQLLALVNRAPASTIAFYNAPSDTASAGNLWVYCHKGKRAADFSSITIKRLRLPYGVRPTMEQHRNVYGFGNVVDFQAIQWLLSQDKPRYMLTDGCFTGNHVTKFAAEELLANALSRKKLEQVRNLKDMRNILDKWKLS